MTKWSREESDRRRLVELVRRKNFTYMVKLTADEYDQLRHATLLNRRMLDRSAEHGIFNKVLTMIMAKCREQLKAAFPPDEPFDR